MDNAVTRRTAPPREVALHWVRRVAVEALARHPTIVRRCLNSVHLNVVLRLSSSLNSWIRFEYPCAFRIGSCEEFSVELA